jgi:hypothetical protein
MFRICAASLVQRSFIEMDDLKSYNERNPTLGHVQCIALGVLPRSFS